MTEQTFGKPIPMATGVQFCYICPTAGVKIGHRKRIVLCTTFSGEGRCEEHRHVPDTEIVPCVWSMIEVTRTIPVPTHIIWEVVTYLELPAPA